MIHDDPLYYALFTNINTLDKNVYYILYIYISIIVNMYNFITFYNIKQKKQLQKRSWTKKIPQSLKSVSKHHPPSPLSGPVTKFHDSNLPLSSSCPLSDRTLKHAET